MGDDVGEAVEGADAVVHLAWAIQPSRDDEELRSIPVVVLTTSKAEEDIVRTYDLGVNSFEGFAVNKAKQLVVCNPDGYVVGDAILFHLAKDAVRIVGRPLLLRAADARFKPMVAARGSLTTAARGQTRKRTAS